MISKRSLKLFKKAAKTLPAYKDFLEKANCNPAFIKRVPDFANVPITSKKTYLQHYAQQDLVWPADWNGPMAICSTSGSTGEPYYFPRSKELAEQASWMAEMFLRNSSYGKGRTLVLMGFGMGVWIGGIITLRAFEIAAERMGAPVSFLPTGYNKVELFKALKNIAPGYDQTIIIGYPPFVKEIVDEAEAAGIDMRQLHIRLVFAAEAFTETFRNYVSYKAAIKNPLFDTMNIYGSADIGAMAYETPLSILVRRLAIEDPFLYKELFGQMEKTPTLAQYNPKCIEFEAVGNELIITGNSALPLIKYAIGDHGGVLTYKEMVKLFKRYNLDLSAETDKARIGAHTKKHPFVFVYERTDLAITLHGMIIYPEFIKEGLLMPGLPAYFTERFSMSTKHDVRHNQFIQINIELQQGVEPSKELEAKALEAIHASLVKKSSEFAEVSKSKASRKLVQIVLWPNGHPRYFNPGVKQKWVEKS
ncbi:MAG TPA: hypothetical protein VM124_03930 [Candidatus Limnocylindrales bacterium]|nr:hypothetical protein [Candidatus Limnocylindrales bacterium]